MKRTEMNRRDFTRLTAAAFGGVVAGSMVGCGDSGTTEPAPAGGDAAPAGGGDAEGGAAAADGASEEVSLLLEEPHVCRGLNTCMNKGASGENACAGQGTCASVAEHSCTGQNECKGQGGCGGKEGENSCKGEGGCGVPLEHGWEGVREKFEAAMKAAGKDFGAAPAAG
ncbi:MAG: hypothetical protein KDA93_08870 [Planctomycetaceae bacterium]|nr:hypothetical protein [Planctomycetaceae bacterium]